MSSSDNYSKLGKQLRECAKYVDRGEFDSSIFYQALADLQNYTNTHSKSDQNQGDQSKSGKVGFGKRLGKLSLNTKKEKQRSEEETKKASELLDKMDKQQDDERSWWKGSGTEAQDDNTPAAALPGKPPFQRPSNRKSTMIANGWIEQQRRSKMRVVWKGVLVSLVKGRSSSEETTLWIQREMVDAATGKRELEALHQVPIKWLEEVTFLDFYGDNRFSVKVYNVTEEFFFRCADQESAHEWVSTLRSIKEEVDKSMGKSNTSKSVDNNFPEDESPSTNRVPQSSRSASTEATNEIKQTDETKPRKTIKELRSIAHGAGIKTHGMERSDLERVVANLEKPQTDANNSDAEHRAAVEAARLREEQERQEEARRKTAEAEKEEEDQRQREEEERRKIEEEQRQRVAGARRKAEEERRVLEEQRRAAYVAEEQRRLAEEQRRRVAEQQAAAQAAAQQRQREEAARAQQHYQQQQQQWQQQQAAQQQWQQQQRAAAEAQQRAAQQAQWDQWQRHQQQQQQQQQYPQQQQQQNPFTANGNHQQQAGRTQGNQQSSTADLKYTKMAEESGQGGEEKITAIKRNILVHWALQPPTLQHLRPITDLITNIHSVFPPAFGVNGHEYFKKWKALSKEDLTPVGAGSADDEKLKKTVRKLRFFLHPDKLPRDLDEEQAFTCKMLWDISSDAWEEYKKRHEELDWIQK
mmetsp:Transcript_3347/g.5109  ORF Transcript_3347/g.5109 Transcript_3347/m.5109 type:complete len:696 (-) Transcript_3347:79-2166(-)